MVILTKKLVFSFLFSTFYINFDFIVHSISSLDKKVKLWYNILNEYFYGGIEMNVAFCNIIGNDILKKRVENDISNNSLSHAYIIEGPRGSGRHTMAYQIAAALSCLSDSRIPCGDCKNCKKILSRRSPDIFSIALEDDKITIGVDAIRRIKEDMSTAPNDLRIKVYIIDDADSMTPQAQNAFLLSLEDPPEYVLFFLICENSASLLETVRSRAPALRMQRLDGDVVREYVLEHDKHAVMLKDEDEQIFDIVIFASDGCIGKAIELLDPKKRKILLDEREITEKIISLLSYTNRTEVLSVINSIGSKRSDVLRYLSSVRYAVRDLILLKKTDTVHLCFYQDREEAQELSTRYTSVSLTRLYDALCDAANELESNSNVRLTLLNMVQKAELI